MQEKILIFDFGSQYTQLIARKVRELNVYCEILPYNKIKKIDKNIKGVILSGSPFSVRDSKAPAPDLSNIKGKLPLLGICYGAQYIAQKYGGKVAQAKHREYGRANLKFIDTNNTIFKGIKINTQVWMSHADTITNLNKNYKIIASTTDIEIAAYSIECEDTFGLQFHPEVYHTSEGKKLLENFIINICKCSQEWTPDSFVSSTVTALKNKLQNDKVVLGLSGGVDSTVAAVLLHKAIGKNLNCIFVDNGLLRKNEFVTVLQSYKGMGLHIKGVDAKDKFISRLEGISDPEQKRKIIGNVFIEVFDEEASKLSEIKWLAQGTIYPDIIESISVNGLSSTIKSHHNVGGLPDFMKLKIVEPLNLLFKDEVRKVGETLKISKEILYRHPFPGPGLGIRILGEVKKESIKILQEADDIFINSLKEDNLYNSVWQAVTVLLPVRSVGVMGDERTYENTLVLRAVNSTDGMTADWSRLPHDFLAKVSNKIINRVKGINRVVYDISSKPPATIEWE